MLLIKISGSRKHLPWGIICGILHVFSSPCRFISFVHLDTYRGIPSWAETENRFSGNDQHLSSVLSGDKSLSSQLSNQRSWTRQLKLLEKSMNHCKKTASIEWTLSTQRTGRHLRNSQWEERSFSEPRTYLRAGWHRIDRIEKLSSVLIA